MTPPSTALAQRLALHAGKLGCPACRSVLRIAEDLSCGKCGRTYAIRDGIPILLHGVVAENAELTRVAAAKESYYRYPWRARLAYPSLTNDSFQRLAIGRFLDSFPHGSLVVDVGTSLRESDPRVLRLDLVFSRNLDLVGDAHALPFLDATVDGILCTGLIEHVADPIQLVEEIRRVLRPGGRAYATAPFIQGYHPSPTDYRRYTREGIAQLFAGCEVVSLRTTRGSGSALAWILAAVLTELFSFNRFWLYRLVGVPIRWMCLPLKYLDVFLVRNQFDHYATSGFTIEVSKPQIRESTSS
ncbi:MAG: hypothetical protein QOD06_2392 [Candidatus Binatota bacterium]|jgi:SAM-dependent methyltransferase|nr:hypothetical protein [Candidatus Binatota bacterium]